MKRYHLLWQPVSEGTVLLTEFLHLLKYCNYSYLLEKEMRLNNSKGKAVLNLEMRNARGD